MITKIETTQTMDTMGEATESDLLEWCNHLDDELNAQYPGAHITVKSSTRAMDAKLYVESSLDEDITDPEGDVKEHINYVWDKWI